MSLLDKIASPALPVPNREYSPAYMGQLLNVLRIFFEGVTRRFNALTGRNGGRFLELPVAEFYDATEQVAANVDTAYPVSLGTVGINNGFAVGGPNSSRVTVTHSGRYFVDFHAQLESQSGSAKTVYVWAAVDGAPGANSTKTYTIEGTGKAMEITWNSVVELQAGSYVEIEWATDDVDAVLRPTAAASPHPGVPSASLSIFMVSGIA